MAGSRGRQFASTPARRREILAAAAESFAEHGYDRASLRDIARRAGITHAGLLHHFASKDELLEASLADLGARYREAVPPSLDDGESIRHLVEAMIRDPRMVRSWLALSVAAADPDHPAHQYFLQRRAEAHQALMARTADATEAAFQATLLLAVLDGLRIQWLLDPELDVAAVLHRFYELMRQGAATRP